MAPKVRVIFHDDDDTPAEFVLFALQTYFGLDEPGARKIVDEICAKGSAVAATMQRPPAEDALKRVQLSGEQSGFKCRVTLEPDSA